MDRPVYIYVTSMGHSASTLISFVLNTHPPILSIGEMHAPVHPAADPLKRMCSCGVPMYVCPFYTELGRRLEAQGFRFETTSWDLAYAFEGRRALSRLMFRSLRSNALEAVRDVACASLPAYRRRRDYLDRMHVAFVREALDITGRQALVDAYKDPVRTRYLSRLPGIDLKVIHLMRDPRGWTYSQIKNQQGQGDPAQIVRGWVRRQKNILRQLDRLPGHFTLRYEELCARPADVLGRLGEFLGLGPIAPPENFRAREHHILGNKMRMGSSGVSDGTGRIRHDERWREALSPEAVAAVVRVAGPMARSLGYEL